MVGMRVMRRMNGGLRSMLDERAVSPVIPLAEIYMCMELGLREDSFAL